MPAIQELYDVTEPITIKRGSLEFHLDCYLEKISNHNKAYTDLLQRGRELAIEQARLTGEISLLMNAEFANATLGAEVEGRLPTVAEMEKRSKDYVKNASKAQDGFRANEAAQLRNKAERIAFLTKSWDLTEKDDKGDDVPHSITPDNIALFSAPLIEHIVSEIEGSVFGFLGRPNATTN